MNRTRNRDRRGVTGMGTMPDLIAITDIMAATTGMDAATDDGGPCSGSWSAEDRAHDSRWRGKQYMAACAYAAFAAAALDWRDPQYRNIMQPASNTPASPIQVPKIDTDEPVAVIPVASVAPLDGPPDGERINTFAVAPRKGDSPLADFESRARERVLAKPLTYLAAAFSLGVVLARVLR